MLLDRNFIDTDLFQIETQKHNLVEVVTESVEILKA